MMADDYQLDYNGLIMGDGTAYEVVDWAGLEEYAARNTDTTIPYGWGAIGGAAFVNTKVATVTIECVDPTAIPLLEAYLTPPPLSAPTTLYPIRWKFPEREELIAYGRVARRTRARTITTALGMTAVVFELEFPDPRCYAYATTSVTAPVYFAGTDTCDLATDSGANLGTDLTVDSGKNLGFDLGGIPASGQVIATNGGNVETYPVITFQVTGNSVNAFTLTNVTTGVVLSIGGLLNIGDTLIVDMHPANAGASAVIPVELNGASEYSYWQPPRTTLALPPGDSVLQLDVQSGSGTLTALVEWQSAYL